MDPKVFVPNYERPYFYTRTPLPPPPPQPFATAVQQPHGFNLNYKVSPSVLLVLIILAMVLFIFGLVHLLVRYIMRPYDRDPHEFDNVTALQGQLQQLFHLHDSGVDQCFIDKLLLFSYKSITGVRDPFDCAVCLCEFKGEDMLRLLPNCSHAFHMDCIDTWLLSHSTCPLCRDSLLSDFTPSSSSSPIVFVLDSIENSRKIVNTDQPRSSSIEIANSHLSNEEFGFDKGEMVKEEDNKEKIVTNKLGNFKNVDGCCSGCDVIGVSSEKQTIDGRRCYSMGTLEYVMNDNSSLQVLVKTEVKKQASKKSCLPITPSHRPALSDSGGDSRRDFKGIEVLGSGSGRGGDANGKTKRDSFSISKIWLRGKKEKATSTLGAAIRASSTGSFSFRFERWVDDQETQSCQWMDPPPLEASNPPSFGRSLLRLMGWKQTKVVHPSFSTNV